MALCMLMCRYGTQSLNTQTQTETALRELLQQAGLSRTWWYWDCKERTPQAN